MPALNPRQFVQQALEGMPESSPVSRPRIDAGPGPTHKRGQVGEFQGVMNFDAPGLPLMTDRAGLVPVDYDTDPDWDSSAWDIGGRRRVELEGGRGGSRAIAVDVGWSRAPVETIGPDTELRTAQTIDEPYAEPDPYRVDTMEEHVDLLRERGPAAFRDPETGERELPWVAQVNDKRYLLEGHHRAVAARTRGDGSFPARVLRGGNFGQIEEQLYDGPYNR